VQPNEPNQPDPTQPEFGPWGPNPTRLNANLDPGAPTRPEIGFKLVKRCKKITHLNLRSTSMMDCKITNVSLQSIIQHLNTSLEELYVKGTKIDFDALLQLKSVATLKLLVCDLDDENMTNLKLQLPQIRITDKIFLQIAASQKIVYGIVYNDLIWEIRAKQQDLFKIEVPGFTALRALHC
jgi:hypothetical protein